jgi:hypothetical protein
MIDLLILTKNGIPDEEIKRIVERNSLQTNSKAGKIYYDNINLKNIVDGFYLRIETNKRLKLVVSLHKYKNLLEKKGFVNYDLFTMSEANETAQKLGAVTGLQLNDLNVYGYEIGMNLYLPQDCSRYLDKIKSIGILDSKRDFFVNPKYKNERLKTTYFYREMRKVFKVYDKNFEMQEKRRKEDTGHPNILRIETVYNRVEKMPMRKFLTKTNMHNMTDRFIKDWRTVQFEISANAPKGTGSTKQKLCEDILTHGKEKVLTSAQTDLKEKVLTPKQFRRIREFIQYDWDTFKASVKVVQGNEEREFREAIKNTIILLK